MAVIEIWHNPRCSKSRQTLTLLEERGIAPKVRRYLEEAPDEAELRAVLTALGMTASALIRNKESTYRELGLGKESDEATLLAAMAAHPILIERPIVFAGDKAAIGRPPEAVLDIL
ncbi:Arsenate reductase [Roseovarius sp. THAF9]|uniref:arsenate reductase (glutaredoxin) n=1 Tax=Roseovarius sp. THAF9 TaxID=2587847 RepID=UPI001267A3B8|nr:arsenate reductase (glutaredoxin) [Roseovarius sp. THAF9]QFT94011.1 Arsenate reductase [Roseovarius sp. THAF9]